MSGGQPRHRPNAARRRHIKRQLAARDGATCFYCGHQFAVLGEATLDHLIPYSQWPTWRQVNLVLACPPCNQAKADRLPQTILRPARFGPGLTTGPAPASRKSLTGALARRLLAVRGASNRPGNHAPASVAGWTARHATGSGLGVLTVVLMVARLALWLTHTTSAQAADTSRATSLPPRAGRLTPRCTRRMRARPPRQRDETRNEIRNEIGACGVPDTSRPAGRVRAHLTGARLPGPAPTP